MTITICEPTYTANGLSQRAVLQDNGEDVEWKALVKTTMPWNPNSYDESSSTLDFSFRPTAELTAFVTDLESDVVQQVAKDTNTFFGKTISPEEIRSMFQSSLRTTARGTDHFKCKGRYSNIKFWDKNQKPTKEPTIWGSDDEYKLVIRAGAIWFNDKSWGISFDLRHLQIFDTDCPF